MFREGVLFTINPDDPKPELDQAENGASADAERVKRVLMAELEEALGKDKSYPLRTEEVLPLSDDPNDSVAAKARSKGYTHYMYAGTVIDAENHYSRERIILFGSVPDNKEGKVGKIGVMWNYYEPQAPVGMFEEQQAKSIKPIFTNILDLDLSHLNAEGLLELIPKFPGETSSADSERRALSIIPSSQVPLAVVPDAVELAAQAV